MAFFSLEIQKSKHWPRNSSESKCFFSSTMWSRCVVTINNFSICMDPRFIFQSVFCIGISLDLESWNLWMSKKWDPLFFCRFFSVHPDVTGSFVGKFPSKGEKIRSKWLVWWALQLGVLLLWWRQVWLGGWGYLVGKPWPPIKLLTDVCK